MPVFIPFISVLSSVLFMDEPYCKFMVTYDIQNYFRQFTKFLSKKINFQ